MRPIAPVGRAWFLTYAMRLRRNLGRRGRIARRHPRGDRPGLLAYVAWGTDGDWLLFFQLSVNGLTLGSVYALIALGYTMVYGVLKLINFAHGDVYMVGVFMGFAADRVPRAAIAIAASGCRC